MTPELHLQDIDEIVARIGRHPDAAISILQAIQKQYRYLPEAALRRVCEVSEITPAAITSIATFFPQFRRHPAGKHTIAVCDGTACHLKGAPEVFDALAKQLDLAPDENTDKDGLFTLEKVRCLGCCTLAPAVQIDGVTYGHVSPETVPGMLEDFLAQANQSHSHTLGPVLVPENDATEIRIGLGSCCVAGGSEKVRQALDHTLAQYRISVHVKRVSCVGMCHQTPLMQIVVPGQPPITYAKLIPEDVQSIILSHFAPHGPMHRARAMASTWLARLYSDDAHDIVERHAMDPAKASVSAFLSVQRHLATEYCGEIDPTDLDEYFKRDGFRALLRCLPDAQCASTASGAPLSPPDIIDEILRSGLRGRGGAGFSTGKKWTEVHRTEAPVKYVICNGDEGDPGSFMDRMILESYPYRILEGMLIASVAVGAHEGIFYIRAEYPLATLRMQAAIDQCIASGILGDHVLGSSHRFHAEVRPGAGAFVCGEETALIASLEGRRPMPRYRPPYPAHQGFHDCPTLINNVETLALIPWILRHGADAFSAFGTARSKGTKVFALAGKITRGGLIEVPMGMTLRQIVEDIGGGVADGRTFKAVQVGGPSGGCIPASMIDLPVDFEALTEAGAMMGSGGFVVMDDTDCMVEMTRYFLSFTQLESCGKCTPCRVGTYEMLEILNRLCDRKGTEKDLVRLFELAKSVKQHSLCGLGKTAPNPVLTGMTHFREEFEAHVAGRCLAHKCKPFITYSITQDCIGCTKCAQRCPVNAIPLTPYAVHVIEDSKCVRCGSCYAVCPVAAVKVE